MTRISMQLLCLMIALSLCELNASWAQQSTVKLTPPKADPKAPAEVLQAVEGLRDYYKKAENFRATFTQNYHSKLTKRQKSSKGQVDFARPTNMHWAYTEPEKKSFITNGKSLWVVEWEQKRVTIREDLQSSALESSLAFLWGGGDLLADYAITRLQVENLEGVLPVNKRLVLELVPKHDKNQFDTLYLVLDPASHRIEETLLVDTIGNLNHLIFSNPETNQTFPAGHFIFTAPGPDWTEERL